MVFKNPFKRSSNVVSSPVGDRYYREGKVIFDPDGNMHIEYGKERDRHVEIQSYKDSCDVNNLIKRYENGDQTALLRSNSGVYCDISSMPKNIHEAVKLSKSVESMYDGLAPELKGLYPTLMDFSEAFTDQAKFDKFVTACHDISNRGQQQKVQKVEEVKSDA